MAAAGRTEDSCCRPGGDWPDRADRSLRSREPLRVPSSSRPCGCWRACMPERQVVGRFTNPARRSGALRRQPAVAFPASQIQSLELPEDGPRSMRVNFMGLTGPLGVLPLAYSELVLERLRARDRTMRDFFDIFNHRMISLFFQAWEKYRFAIPYERGERDRFSYHVLALLGLGTPGLQDRQDVPDDSLLFYSGLLSLHARSAPPACGSCCRIISACRWRSTSSWAPGTRWSRESQCSLGESRRDAEKLGLGAWWETRSGTSNRGCASVWAR